METPSDEALLHEIARGEENALAQLYDRYGKPAYSLAYRILGNAHDAEDAVQDVFLNIWRRSRSFDIKRGNAKSWLLSSVHHRAIDLIRRRKGLQTVSQSWDFQQQWKLIGEVWVHVVNSLDRQAIDRALGEIPQEQKKVIEMAYFGGYTHREIAEMTQEPLGTVKSRIRMGMEKLRKLLQDHRAEA